MGRKEDEADAEQKAGYGIINQQSGDAVKDAIIIKG